MPVSNIKDQFANRFAGTVTETVAGTIAIEEIPTNVDVFAKQAFVLHRLEYIIPSTVLALMIGANDSISIAIVNSPNVVNITPTSMNPTDPAVVDIFNINFSLRGAAANFAYQQMPFVRSFTDMPGGGLIVAARPLYIAIQGDSLAAVAGAYFKGYFTRKELKPEDYMDLVDYYRMIS